MSEPYLAIQVVMMPRDTNPHGTIFGGVLMSYLDQAGATGTVDVLGPGLVQVSVTVTASTPLLGIPVSQTRTHTAQLQVGVTHGEGLS